MSREGEGPWTGSLSGDGSHVGLGRREGIGTKVDKTAAWRRLSKNKEGNGNPAAKKRGELKTTGTELEYINTARRAPASRQIVMVGARGACSKP